MMEGYYLLGDIEKSLTCYNHALRIIKYHLGYYHPLLINIYSQIGKLYYNDNKFTNSLEYFIKAFELSVKILGNNHPVTASYCNKLGHVFKNCKEYEKSITMYERSLMIYRTILGENTLTVAFSYFYISSSLSIKGDFKNALEYSLKSLSIRENNLGPNHLITLGSYYQVAYIADKMDNYIIAISHFEILLDQLKLLSNNNNNDKETILQDIQNITKAIIRIKFRLMSPNQKIILDNIRTLNTHATSNILIETVIEKLYQNKPSEYLDSLLSHAIIDKESYIELQCIFQLVEDQDVMITGFTKLSDLTEL
jgi:tetratricopeptide (TPR) repeat protein